MLNHGLFVVLTVQALAHLKASEAVVLTYTVPAWASLFAWPILNERPTFAKLLALVPALGDVALLVGAGTPDATWAKLPAAAMALGAAIAFALGISWASSARCACRPPRPLRGRPYLAARGSWRSARRRRIRTGQA
jgi:drug/metabolite transporter (DMT)-like permease